MNILSVYFSGTNNTKHINDVIKLNVNNEHKFDELRIGCDIDVNSFVLSNYDLLIIGSPIYVGVYPKIFTKFIYDNFKEVENKKIVLYQTSGSDNPAGIYEMNKFFEEKNDVVGLVSFCMANNFYLNGMFAQTEAEDRKRFTQKNEEQSKYIADFINGDIKTLEKVSLNKTGYKIGRFAYNILNGPYLKKYAYKDFSSGEKCVGCGVCEKECPTNNINVSRINKSVDFGKKCATCLRCINICPHSAILYKGKEHDKFEMFN